MSTRRLPIGASSATTLIVRDRELVAFAGCDYLGLAHDPLVIGALRAGLEEHGISASASRETTGNRMVHEELESDLARFLGLEAALILPDGYLANLVAAQGLAPETELALVDAEAHASVRDALAAIGVETVEYAHGDARSAAEALARCSRGLPGPPGPAENGRRARNTVAVFTDGVFPALQRLAPLAELLALLGPDDALVVDDCHGFGVLGERGRGTCELLGLDDPRIVVTTTLSKALGCYGGVVAGSAGNVARTAARSRAYVCSTPVPPALAAAGRAALREIEASPRRLERLRANIARLRTGFARLGLRAPEIEIPVFAFTLSSTLTVGVSTDAPDAPDAIEAFERGLLERGFIVPFVDYPAGQGAGRGYFRLALNAEHTSAQIDALLAALASLLGELAPRAAESTR